MMQAMIRDEMDGISGLLRLEADEMERLTGANVGLIRDTGTRERVYGLLTPCRVLEYTRKRLSFTPVPPKRSFAAMNLDISPAACSWEGERGRLRCCSIESPDETRSFSKKTSFASDPPVVFTDQSARWKRIT